MVSFLSMHPTESRYWERGRDDVVEKAHILCGSLIMMAMIQYWWPLMLSSWYRVHCIAADAARPARQQHQPRNRGWQCRPPGQSGSRALLNTSTTMYSRQQSCFSAKWPSSLSKCYISSIHSLMVAAWLFFLAAFSHMNHFPLGRWFSFHFYSIRAFSPDTRTGLMVQGKDALH